MPTEPATFERLTDLDATAPTLIEGLPGHGLVAAIAVDQITEQLGLAHHGSIVSDEFPPLLSFEDGLVRDLVRVYAGEDPPLLTLQSDIALPPSSFQPLADCVIGQCADEFERAIFLAGVPAESESRIGDVASVATTEAMRTELEAAGIDLVEDPGVIGGITGAIARKCYHSDIPAMVLVVRSHPFLPDPGAAQRLIEEALEPLVDFDIDTRKLREQADEIQTQLQQVADQYRRLEQDQAAQQRQPTPSMYQ